MRPPLTEPNFLVIFRSCGCTPLGVMEAMKEIYTLFIEATTWIRDSQRGGPPFLLILITLQVKLRSAPKLPLKDPSSGL